MSGASNPGKPRGRPTSAAIAVTRQPCDRGFVPAQVELAHRFGLDEVAHLLPTDGADDDLRRLGRLLEPGSNVHRIAGGHRRAAERIADDDLARLDADPRL